MGPKSQEVFENMPKIRDVALETVTAVADKLHCRYETTVVATLILAAKMALKSAGYSEEDQASTINALNEGVVLTDKLPADAVLMPDSNEQQN